MEGIREMLPVVAIFASAMGYGWVAMIAMTVYAVTAKKPTAEDTFPQGLATIRQPVAPWQIIYGRRRVSGIITYIQVVDRMFFSIVTDQGETISGLQGLTHTQLHLVVTLAGHVSEEIEAVYFNDEIVPINPDGTVSGRYNQWVRIYKSLGDEAGQPFLTLESVSLGKWTAAHRQTGRTKLHVMLVRNSDLFPHGIPNITAIVKGVCDIRDPRDDSVGWSDNPALCRAHYLCNSEFGMGADFDDEINQDALIASANQCDELLPIAAGGTEKRYTLNGLFTAEALPEDVIFAMNSCCAGKTVQIGSTWYVYVGGYDAPTLELTDADLAGPITIQANLSRRDGCNSIQVSYCSPDDHWQPVNTPALESDTAIAEDDDEQIWRRLDLTPFVTSGTLAQRLQKIDLLRTRQQLSVGAQWKLKALRAMTGRNVSLTFAKYGWTQKAFEVDGFTFAVDQARDNSGPRLVVGLTLRETAASVFDWQTSEEQAQDAAPNSNLPDPFDVGVPGAPMIDQSQYETSAGGGVKIKVTVSWERSADFAVVQHELRYRFEADPDEQASYITYHATRALQETFFDVEPGIYVFSVRSITSLGVKSEWSTTTQEIIALDALPPEDITGLSIQAAGGLALLRWDLHSDLFVREGGWIEFRHSEATEALAIWEESFSIGDAIPGNNNQAALPLKAGTYLAKARSQSGRPSVRAAMIGTKQATVLNYVNIALLQEDPVFSGIHSNTAAPDGLLKITATGLIDAAPDFDTIADLDSMGGIAGAGTYDFATGLDLGTVQRTRLTSQLVGFVANVNDRIDLRTEPIDDWEDFDGTLGAVADAYVEVRETDSDPASSPIWSGWKRLDAAEFQARGFDFRVQLLTGDASYNVLLSQVRVAAAQVT